MLVADGKHFRMSPGLDSLVLLLLSPHQLPAQLGRGRGSVQRSRFISRNFLGNIRVISPRNRPGRPGDQRGVSLRLLADVERLLDWRTGGDGEVALAGRGTLDLASLAATAGGGRGLSGDHLR